MDFQQRDAIFDELARLWPYLDLKEHEMVLVLVWVLAGRGVYSELVDTIYENRRWGVGDDADPN